MLLHVLWKKAIDVEKAGKIVQADAGGVLPT